MIRPGQTIEFLYPTTTHVRVEQPTLTLRRVTVYWTRDLVEQPLTLKEFLQRPFIRRSRWLIGGVDAHSRKFRQFYLGCSPTYIAPSQLRIGEYEHGNRRPRFLLYTGFDATVDSRNRLINIVKTLVDCDNLRIFADDLRLVS